MDYLWKPSNQRVSNSLLEEFRKFVGAKTPQNFESFWRWSVTNPEIFWSKFWDFSKIIGSKGKEVIRKNKEFNKTKFFPDAKINYAENILKKKNEDIAINFLSEAGFEEKISWSDLYYKVCKLSFYF